MLYQGHYCYHFVRYATKMLIEILSIRDSFGHWSVFLCGSLNSRNEVSNVFLSISGIAFLFSWFKTSVLLLHKMGIPLKEVFGDVAYPGYPRNGKGGINENCSPEYIGIYSDLHEVLETTLSRDVFCVFCVWGTYFCILCAIMLIHTCIFSSHNLQLYSPPSNEVTTNHSIYTLYQTKYSNILWPFMWK